MSKVLKILKINVYSIIATPLLILATCLKLIAKAMERILIFLILAVISLATGGIVHAIKSSPNNFIVALIWIIAGAIAFGVVVALIIWVFAKVSGMITVAWSRIVSLFTELYNYTYTGYLKLYTECENEYRILSLDGRKVPNAIFCLFFTILRGLSRLIVGIISLSIPIGIGISVLVVLLPILKMWFATSSTFGLNLFQFWGTCSLPSALSGILLYLITVAVSVTAIIVLAISWREWAQELQMTDKQISKEINEITESDLQVAVGSSKDMEKNLAPLKKLEEHVSSLDELGERVQSVLAKKDNAMLRSQWGIYMRNLSPIVEACSSKKGLHTNKLRRMLPKIDLLDQQRKDIVKLLNKLEKELNNPSGTTTFFVGCDTPEKLEKRYKVLCKAYHPDITEGDTSTFQKMQNEYEQLKNELTNE